MSGSVGPPPNFASQSSYQHFNTNPPAQTVQSQRSLRSPLAYPTTLPRPPTPYRRHDASPRSENGADTARSDMSEQFIDHRYVLYPTPAYDEHGTEPDRLLLFDFNEVPTYAPRFVYDEEHENTFAVGTYLATFDARVCNPYMPSSFPIYQTSTFYQRSITTFGAYDYSRSGNPTRTAVEQVVANIEGAHAAFAFASGSAAIASVTRLCACEQEIVCCSDMSGATARLLTKLCTRMAIKVTIVDTTDVELLRCTCTSSTRIIWIETPSNPMMKVSDIKKIAGFSCYTGALLVVDSSLMSPFLMQPLTLGADMVIHSATAFLGGHSDVTAGFVCCKNQHVARNIAYAQNAEGNALSPFDSWLVLRGIKTLALRLERSLYNAGRVADYLAESPLVKKLHYPGHVKGTDPKSYEVHNSQTYGGGCVMSFETGSVRLSKKVCDSCVLFKIGVGYGGCTSSIEMPCVLSHATIPVINRKIPPDLIRISLGIEYAEDLIWDLTQSFTLAQRICEGLQRGATFEEYSQFL